MGYLLNNRYHRNTERFKKFRSERTLDLRKNPDIREILNNRKFYGDHLLWLTEVPTYSGTSYKNISGHVIDGFLGDFLKQRNILVARIDESRRCIMNFEKTQRKPVLNENGKVIQFNGDPIYVNVISSDSLKYWKKKLEFSSICENMRLRDSLLEFTLETHIVNGEIFEKKYRGQERYGNNDENKYKITITGIKRGVPIEVLGVEDFIEHSDGFYNNCEQKVLKTVAISPQGQLENYVANLFGVDRSDRVFGYLFYCFGGIGATFLMSKLYNRERR